MEGSAAELYASFVERDRAAVDALRERVRALERAEVEAWFQCIAFSAEDADPDDRAFARHHRAQLQTDLTASREDLVVAERRHARYERTLTTLTPH